MSEHHQVLIVGGGTAGITVAAQLRNHPDATEVAIIDPADKHYYQPLWTLVGGGVFPREESARNEADVIPPGVTWVQDAVTGFQPDDSTLTTRGGQTIAYDYLVVAAGLQVDWGKIPGLTEAVGKPGTGVCSNYAYETVNSTWDNIRNFRGGVAVFTQPATPVKCGGAPQKIMYLAEDYFRRQGIRDRCRVVFANAKGEIFQVKKYADALLRIVQERGIEVLYNTDLNEIRPEAHEAVFRNPGTGETSTLRYDLLHVTPPMSAPDFLKQSPLGDAGGWVDVDARTLQHNRYPNVFGLGDCSSLPTSKTGAAVRKQAPVVVENLLARLHNRPLTGVYDGYTACPIVTGYGRLILAEFGYDKQPMESFPFDQSVERYSMYALKAHALPRLYWHGLLKGRL